MKMIRTAPTQTTTETTAVRRPRGTRTTVALPLRAAATERLQVVLLAALILTLFEEQVTATVNGFVTVADRPDPRCFSSSPAPVRSSRPSRWYPNARRRQRQQQEQQQQGLLRRRSGTLAKATKPNSSNDGDGDIFMDPTPSSLSTTTSSSSTTTTTISSPPPNTKDPTTTNSPVVEWNVYVDQTKNSLDKGGGATLDAFLGLASSPYVSGGSDVKINVRPALLPRNTKAKPPAIRCVRVDRNNSNPNSGGGSGRTSRSMDIGNVDSVDKVYRVLTKHMGVSGIRPAVCECLKWKYRGNVEMENGKVALAIDAYDKAYAISSEQDVPDQRGAVLLMRSLAYLRRAASHKEELRTYVNDLLKLVPDTNTISNVYEQISFAENNAAFSNAVFRRVMNDCSEQTNMFRKTQYQHGLYQYALLQAAQDALQATQFLPDYPTALLRAGETLAPLWKLKEAQVYYEKAMALDASLATSVKPIITRLQTRQDLLENARTYGWSEETLRLALDVST